MQILLRDIIIVQIIMCTILAFSTKIFRKQRLVTFYHVGVLLFAMLMTVILSLTGVSPLSGFDPHISWDGINYIPMKGILQIIHGGSVSYIIMNIVGNLLMFAPVGFFLPLLVPGKRNLLRTMCTGFLISLGIECSQLFLCRGTDIDDLILNTLGAVIGCICYYIFARVFKKITKRIQEAANEKKGWLYCWCILIPYLVSVLCGFYDRYWYYTH